MDREFTSIEVGRVGNTTTISLNRPERLNVLTSDMMTELTVAFNDVGDSDARGVILAAKGRLFSAGHDFTEMASRDVNDVRELFRTCTTMMQTMQAIPQPVVAKVHALATGAGCQLVASADLAVASDQASFCTPGGKGGLFCTTPLVAVGRSIGRKHALEMAMSGDAIDAATALEWGLVNYVVAPGELDAAADELIVRVTRGSAESKGIGKRAFYKQMEMNQPEAYDYAIEVMSTASVTADAQEGIAAFIEKRRPTWPASS